MLPNPNRPFAKQTVPGCLSLTTDQCRYNLAVGYTLKHGKYRKVFQTVENTYSSYSSEVSMKCLSLKERLKEKQCNLGLCIPTAVRGNWML